MGDQVLVALEIGPVVESFLLALTLERVLRLST
jgi:hypothetical protein